MSIRYSVHHQGRDFGQLPAEEIEKKFKINQLFPTDFVYSNERADWVPITEFLMSLAKNSSGPENMIYPAPPEPPPAPQMLRTANVSVRPTAKPNTPPPRFRATKAIDTSAVAQVNVLPAKATRLHFEISGEARVGEELEVAVHATSEAGALDRSFSETVHLGCDRPLASIDPLMFKNGIAKVKVQCLTAGPHQFFLSLEPIREREQGVAH